MKLTHQALLLPALMTLFACSGDTAEQAQVSKSDQQAAGLSGNKPRSADAPKNAKGANQATNQQGKVASKTGTTQDRHAALQSAGQDPAAEMRSLVPSDAFLWVELKSLDRLSELLQEVGALVPGVPIPPAEMLLENLGQFGIQSSDVRLDAPMGVALSMGLGMEPAPTFVINVNNAASLAAKLQGAPGMPTPATSGNAVAITLHESYSPDAQHGALLSNDLPAGALTSRLHVAYLVDSFGDQIQAGLSAAKMMAGSQTDSDSAQAFYDHQVDQSLDVLQGTRYLSVGLDLEAGDLSMTYAMALQEDSTYASLSSEPGRDLSGLAGYVSREDAIVFLGSLSKGHLNELVRPMIDGIALNSDYEDGIQMRAAYAELEALLSEDSSSFGLMGHVDKGTTDFSLLLHGVEAKRASEQVAKLFDGFDKLGNSLVATTPVKGFEEDSHFLQYDYVPSPVAATTSHGRETIANLESVFGAPRARLRAVSQGNEAIITLGEGASLANKAAQGELDEGEELRWGIDGIAGRSPAMLMRIDLNRWIQGMARCADGNAFAHTTPSPFKLSTPLEQIPHLWITSWMVLGHTTWEGGLRLDLAAMVEMGQRAGALSGPLPR